MSRFADTDTAQVAAREPVRGVPENVAWKAGRRLDILTSARTLQEARYAGNRGRIAKEPESSPPILWVHVEGHWWISFKWGATGAYGIRLVKRE